MNEKSECVYEDLIKHLENNCVSSMIKCPLKACDNLFRRSDLKMHLSFCQHFKVQCETCETYYKPIE